MVKIFELNKNKKIELTKEELEALLNQIYWQGYNKNSWVYTTPNYYPTYPIYTTTTSTCTNNPYTIKANDNNSNSITIKG